MRNAKILIIILTSFKSESSNYARALTLYP